VKAAVYYETGGPEVFRYEDVAAPVPKANEVLVQVEFISIEGGDTLSRFAGPSPSGPYVVGYQAAGQIIDVGERVTGFKVGDRVVTTAPNGSHAEQRVAPQRTTWLVPDDLKLEDAACIPIAFGTAHDCLFEFGELEEDQWVLIHAGAGGVGLAAIQMAKQAGAKVLATASSNDRLERLREYGLDEGINYSSTDFVAEVMARTEGAGVSLVVDSVGGKTLQGSIKVLAHRGRCISVGAAGRTGGNQVDTSVLALKNAGLFGYYLGGELGLGRRAYEMVREQLSAVAAGTLQVVIDRTFTLSQAAEAHAYIESRQAFGRVVLTP
jgi:NADPH:quinone reductase